MGLTHALLKSTVLFRMTLNDHERFGESFNDAKHRAAQPFSDSLASCKTEFGERAF